MEFMLRSVASLETTLSAIEEKVQSVKDVIARQDLEIKKEVLYIRNTLIDNISRMEVPITPILSERSVSNN